MTNSNIRDELNVLEVEMMGAPSKIFGFKGDQYFEQVLSHIPQNYAFISCAVKLSPDATIIDIGANIGVTTIIAARCVPSGRVVALEPSPRARCCLNETVSQNQLLNCLVVPKCIGLSVGSVPFVESEFLAGSYIGSAASEATTTFVESTTLDALVSELDLNRVDLIKVDVEGFELDVLRGAVETNKRFRPVYVMEFNSFALTANRNISPRELLDFILDEFKEFSVNRDGVFSIVKTVQEARDFLFQNMATRMCIDDIIFGGS